MPEHEHKKYSENSKFRKYTAEEREGNKKNIAEFSELKEGNIDQSKYYTVRKSGEHSLHREKGKSDRRGDWTVDVLDVEGEDHKAATRTDPYKEHELEKVFADFKGIKFGKMGGKAKRSSKGAPKKSRKRRSSKSLKNSSLKKSSKKKSAKKR